MGRQSLIFSGFIQSTYFFPFFFFLGMYRRMAFSSIVVMIQLFAIIIYPSFCAPPGSSFAGKKEFKGSRLKRSFPCQIEMNTGYHHGHDIKEVAGIESIAECQDQCHKHSPPCVGFTWNELGKICHPKEKMSDKKPGQFFFHSGICNAIDDDEGVTDGRMDGQMGQQTDRGTDPLIEMCSGQTHLTRSSKRLCERLCE